MTILSQAKERESSSSYLRFFLGFAGWHPGQLAAEIAKGAWHLLPASRERVGLVFPSSPETLWEEMIDVLEDDDQ